MTCCVHPKYFLTWGGKISRFALGSTLSFLIFVSPILLAEDACHNFFSGLPRNLSSAAGPAFVIDLASVQAGWQHTGSISIAHTNGSKNTLTFMTLCASAKSYRIQSLSNDTLAFSRLYGLYQSNIESKLQNLIGETNEISDCNFNTLAYLKIYDNEEYSAIQNANANTVAKFKTVGSKSPGRILLDMQNKTLASLEYFSKPPRMEVRLGESDAESPATDPRVLLVMSTSLVLDNLDFPKAECRIAYQILFTKILFTACGVFLVLPFLLFYFSSLYLGSSYYLQRYAKKQILLHH